ncbi:MAG TPA: hypothetical protein VM616_06860 [Gammaproteobacteria bacterium]|nr:hypothetical protein [Gammaproteobacteria bacterium]
MRKSLKLPLVAIGLLLAVAAVAVWLVLDNLDRIVTKAIEDNGSAATGTSVDVDGLHIAVRAAEGEIAGLVIDNPPGFDTGHAIRFEDIRLVLDPATLLDDTVRVRELRVGSADINLEQKGSAQSNLQTLVDNVSAYAGPPAGDEDAAESRNVVIDEFVLEAARLRLRSELLGNAEFALPRIRATDVGSGAAGATAADALEEILRPIVAEALETAKSSAVEAGRERLEEEAVERLEGFIDDKLGG